MPILLHFLDTRKAENIIGANEPQSPRQSPHSSPQARSVFGIADNSIEETEVMENPLATNRVAQTFGEPHVTLNLVKSQMNICCEGLATKRIISMLRLLIVGPQRWKMMLLMTWMILE
eukprot:SAG31_NODE_218_length_19934_cov_81.634837_14_plen_118_part_00